MYFSKNKRNFLREPTDGSTEPKFSLGSDKAKVLHWELFKVGQETTAIPMPLCTRSDPSWTDQLKQAASRRQTALSDRLRDIPEWLEEFTEGFVDRDSKSFGSDREHPAETPPPNPLPSNRKTRKTLFIHAFSLGSKS